MNRVLQLKVFLIVEDADARRGVAWRAKQNLSKNCLSLQANGFEVLTVVKNKKGKCWTYCSEGYWEEFKVSLSFLSFIEVKKCVMSKTKKGKSCRQLQYVFIMGANVISIRETNLFCKDGKIRPEIEDNKVIGAGLLKSNYLFADWR